MPQRVLMSVSEGNVEGGRMKASTKPGQLSAGQHELCPLPGVGEGPLSSGLQSGKKTSDAWSSTETPLLVPGPKWQESQDCLPSPSMPQQVSLRPSGAGTVAGASGLDPYRGKGLPQPWYNVPAKTLSWVTCLPRGSRPGDGLGRARLVCVWGVGPPRSREARAPPEDGTPSCICRGSWLRHAGWIMSCGRRPETCWGP